MDLNVDSRSITGECSRLTNDKPKQSWHRRNWYVQLQMFRVYELGKQPVSNLRTSDLATRGCPKVVEGKGREYLTGSGDYMR